MARVLNQNKNKQIAPKDTLIYTNNIRFSNFLQLLVFENQKCIRNENLKWHSINYRVISHQTLRIQILQIEICKKRLWFVWFIELTVDNFHWLLFAVRFNVNDVQSFQPPPSPYNLRFDAFEQKSQK